MGLLNDIGLKYKTDKNSDTHGYLDTYEKYLSEWREKEFTLLEIGVAGKASLNTWKEYFTKAKVFGIDNNPDCAGEGVFIGNATDEKFMNNVLEQIGEPEILVEDSGHVGHETIKIFELFFKRIKSGGLMFIEDSSVWFNTHYSGEFQINGRTEVYNFFADMPYHVEVAGRGCSGNQDFAIDHPTVEPPIPEYSRLLKSIHIYTGLWIFERK